MKMPKRSGLLMAVLTAGLAVAVSTASAEKPAAHFVEECPGCRVQGDERRLVFLVDRAIDAPTVRKRMLDELRTTMPELVERQHTAVIAFSQSGLAEPMGEGYHKPPFAKDRIQKKFAASRPTLSNDKEGNWIAALREAIEREPDLIVILTDGFTNPAGHRAGMKALIDGRESDEQPVTNVIEFRRQGAVLADRLVRNGTANDSLRSFARATGGKYKLVQVGEPGEPGETSMERVIPVLYGTSDKRNYVDRLVTVRGQYKEAKRATIRGIEIARAPDIKETGRRVQATGILEKQTITKADLERLGEQTSEQAATRRRRGPGTYYRLRAVHADRLAPVVVLGPRANEQDSKSSDGQAGHEK
jgi:hypothetical protein